MKIILTANEINASKETAEKIIDLIHTFKGIDAAQRYEMIVKIEEDIAANATVNDEGEYVFAIPEADVLMGMKIYDIIVDEIKPHATMLISAAWMIKSVLELGKTIFKGIETKVMTMFAESEAKKAETEKAAESTEE